MAKQELSAHVKPPDSFRSFYKRYQKISLKDLDRDNDIINISNLDEMPEKILSLKRTMDFPFPVARLFELVKSGSVKPQDFSTIRVYEHHAVPGLELVPGLLPPDIQWEILGRLLHRDLADDQHKTNVHNHYHIPYELTATRSSGQDIRGRQRSFFNCSPLCSETLTPMAPEVHKPITISQFLRQKLRWITLGGQYDWTQKAYPDVVAPKFPQDIGDLIHGIFPNMTPEAAIVNIYSAGDTLAMHRDVSEESNAGLVSVSFGCDGIFVIGIESQDEEQEPLQCIAVRLRSGDAVHMSGASRYAWHGIPLIIPDTCPPCLAPWPAIEEQAASAGDVEVSEQFEAWRGWLAGKRVNLNVRQMRG